MKNLFDSILLLSWAILVLIFAFGLTSFMYIRKQNKLVASQEIKKEERTTVSGEEDVLIRKGKQLFKANCASCHAKNMRKDLTGPALADVEERWAEYPIEDLYAWIRNSSKLIEDGHPRALSIWKEWDKSTMTPFPNLTNEEIDAILKYINAG